MQPSPPSPVKALGSADVCQPGTGPEPGAGWAWLMWLRRFMSYRTSRLVARHDLHHQPADERRRGRPAALGDAGGETTSPTEARGVHGKPRPVLRRAGWTFVDQGLSSVTNLVLSVLVARAVAPEAFGAFALAFSIYLIFLGVSRSLATDSLIVRYSDIAKVRLARGAASAAGVAVLCGLVGAAVVAVAGGLVRSPLRESLFVFALCLPGLLLQDAWRYVFFASGSPLKAALNDGVWAVVQLTAVGGLVIAKADAAWPFILAWGGGAAVAALVGMAQTGVRPELGSALGWAREHGDLAPSFLGEFLLLAGVAQVTTLLVASLAGLAEAGALRGAQVLMGPVNVLFMGAVAFALPEAARLRRRSPDRLPPVLVLLVLLLAGGAMTWGFGLSFLIPADVGRQILGETWGIAEPVLLPLSLLMAVSGGTVGAVVGLRVLERARTGFVLRAVTAPLMLGAATVGASAAGARGAVAGLALALGLSVPVWWWRFAREWRRARR